jgi:hypothetical protein
MNLSGEAFVVFGGDAPLLIAGGMAANLRYYPAPLAVK